MNDFWDIIKQIYEQKQEESNRQSEMLSEYQQREQARQSAIDIASKQLNSSQVEEASQEAPQITVNFSDNNSTNPQQSTVDTSLYNTTKAADNTTIPEIVISSQIDKTIHDQAPLLDPSQLFANSSIDLSQSDPLFNKNEYDMQISKTQDQFTIPSSPFTSSMDTSLFNSTPNMTTTSKRIDIPQTDTSSISGDAPLLTANTNNLKPTDTSLYNTTEVMTPTHANIDTQVNNPNTAVPLSTIPDGSGSFGIDNPLSMPDPSISKISQPMTNTHVDVNSQIQQPTSKVSLLPVDTNSGKLTITNPLSMPNPSISKTSQSMTPTNTNGITNIQANDAIKNSMTLNDIYKNTLEKTNGMGVDTFATPQKSLQFVSTLDNNKALKSSFASVAKIGGNAILSIANAVKTTVFGKTQPKEIDTTSVDFANELGKQLSISEFLKGLKPTLESTPYVNRSQMASLFGQNTNRQIVDAYAETLNNLLGVNANAYDYSKFFRNDLSSGITQLINKKFSELTNANIQAWKKRYSNLSGSKSKTNLSQKTFVDIFTSTVRPTANEFENEASKLLQEKMEDATKIVKYYLSQQDIAKKFVLQLISGGDDNALSMEAFALRNDLHSIALYMLLFGFGKGDNAMEQIVQEYSTDNKQAQKVFGSLPYAMSEIYETMLAGDEATLEHLRQKLTSNVDDHSNEFHILTSMDIALPEVKALSAIANDTNPKNAFAIMQPITGATTQPFNATKKSPINSDATLKKIINGISNIKTVKNDTSNITDQESKLSKAFEQATSNASSYATMLHASNITPNRPFMYESVTDKGLFKEKINFAFDNAKASKLTVDNLTPYVSVAFFKDNKWLVSRAPTMFMYSAVISADIEKDRDKPFASAVVAMSNTTGVLSDFTANQYSTKYVSAEQNAHMVGIFVEPGMNVQIRIGYTPTFSDMDVVFNGFVDGVQAGETLVVTASSYGADLMKPAYQGNEYIGVLRYAHPRDMVVNALSHVKSYHLGARSYFDWIFYNQKQEQTLVNTWLDRVPILSLVPNAFAQDPKYFQNIFAPDMYWPSGSLTTEASAGKFLDHVSLYFSHYSTTPGETAWQVILDAVNRMPGFVAAVRNADERQTVFFGRPEYPYRYTYHPSLFALNKGKKINSMYKKSVMAEASKDKINGLYNQFTEYCNEMHNNFSSAFGKYNIEVANGTIKNMANDFSAMVLSGNRNLKCILSGRCLLVDDYRFVPMNVQSNSSSSVIEEQIKFLKGKIDSIVNDISNKISDVAAGTDYIGYALTKLNAMADMVKNIYTTKFETAKYRYINAKDYEISNDVVADLLICAQGGVLEHFATATDELSNTIYNISRGVDFSIRMMKSREMYKMAADTIMPNNGIPWQLIPYKSKIPATIDGSTMFRRYWIAHSSMNLISNDIHTDPQNIATSVTCYGKSVYTGWDWATLLTSRLVKFILTGQNSIPEEVATINGKKMYGFKVSASKYIIPEDRKDEVYVDENANMPQIRAYVAASVLADKMSRGYNGSLVIVGNHMIEPYDSVLVDDERSNIHGVVDVRKTMIHMSRETGLVTRIVPDMKVGIRDLTISPATRLTSVLSSIALFTITTVGVAAVTIGTGGIGLPIAAAVALGLQGTIKKMIHTFLPPMSMASSNMFVRDTSMDVAQNTVTENGITKGGAIEWKFDNALLLYPLFIGDSYYLPRMRGYNFRDREYWADTVRGWKQYWDEVRVGFTSSVRYMGMVVNADESVVQNAMSELKQSQNFDTSFLQAAKDTSNVVGGN